MWNPCPSGPRCANTAVMRRRTTGATGAPSVLRMPVIPHTSGPSALPGDDGDAGILDIESLDAEPRLATPPLHLLRRLPVGIAGGVPVEVDVVELLQAQIRVVECLEDVPVDQPLQRDATRRDAQQRHVLGHV